ncbi:hypothetical protein CcI6DRAFT_02862 [Frankia sp. CcI6]|nr:hypothetical protein CcI6DRAFT_02862 [Frankia sp. CcI6]KFB03875.1 hypothetical protein ALLO2DRAFT_03391 [Frankia sp. Allo2]OAA29074.1 hypothetical protein AAY23_10177 [Frankia casuarinae]
MRNYPEPRVEWVPAPAPDGVALHLRYREPADTIHPDGWLSPVNHVEDVAHATRLIDAIHHLAGLDAATRRVWVVKPCTCNT